MSTQVDNLNNLGSTHIHNATYQVSRSSVNWFWRRRFFKVFTIYGHGGHLGHVTRTVWTTFRSPDPWRLHMKFGYNWPSSFRGEVVWNCWRTTTDDGRRRTTEPAYTISSPGAFGSGELKSRKTKKESKKKIYSAGNRITYKLNKHLLCSV